ncbi:hypothetical protein KHC23_21985 [Ancylobacter dichloromethanicus]|nr:hypothetical protein [Ancylobacter dichloromethanicus]MBS7556306.1 hypothetical protein [Ancylobacter dichloromethanicus]
MPENNGCHRLDKESLSPLELLRYEHLLAETLRGFLTELCLTNAGVVIAYINARQDSNIDDLVASSAELFIKPGQLHYARKAVIDSDWGLPPHVSIAMRLRHAELTVAFHVIFDDHTVGVHIDSIEFVRALGGGAENLARFETALATARISTH